MKEIPLTQGKVALVDDEDYVWLSQWKWFAWKNVDTGAFYARRGDRHTYGKQVMIAMHREILNLKYGDPRIGDHVKSEHTLDNRRSNLRIADFSQSSANQRLRSDSTSRLKGVCWDKRKSMWMAYINWRGRRKFLGYFNIKTVAHAAYCSAAEELHGEFRRTA